MATTDKPRYTKFQIKCDCRIGAQPKIAVFDSLRSSVKTNESKVRCTYYCKNCTAVWLAEWFLRNGAWNSKPSIRKVRDRKHA